VYSTCLFCNHDLGANQLIEAFPVGRRLAFDAKLGRLWVVCRRCERWNLSPFDERWEAIEQCERLFGGTRLRVSTDHIGLARLGEGLELVRIGEPLRPEFAAWRYGDQFGRRRRRTIMLGAAGVAVVGAVMAGGIATGVLAGGGFQLFNWIPQLLKGIQRRRVVARVPIKDGKPLVVRGSHLERARLLPDATGDAGWSLKLPHQAGETILSGRVAMQATGLIMPRVNARGAGKREVQEAVQRIETAGHPERFLTQAAHHVEQAPRGWGRRGRNPGALPQLPLPTRLAVEMAVNEENERAALEGELELLEMAWQEAEEIAGIADSLTIPAEVDDQLRQLKGEATEKREP
jgi:hypothetical protein